MSVKADEGRPALRRRVSFELLGLGVAILGIAITVYFSVRAERTKSLSLRYLSQRALVSLESGAPRELQISYQGRVVARPYLISARFENIGTVPVEERDIEKPLTLQFSAPGVLGVEITGRHPQDLTAGAMHDSATVILQHKLMNPGDWVSFDVLFDGEPVPPTAALRVSGVPRLVELSSGDKRASFTTLIPLPTPVVYLALFLASGVALILVAIGLYMLGTATRDFAFGPPASLAARADFDAVFADDFNLGSWSAPGPLELSEPTRMLVEKGIIYPDFHVLDDIDGLRNQLAQHQGELAVLGLSTDAAEEVILADMRRLAPAAVATALFYRLPTPVDREARRRVEQLPYTAGTLREFIQRARELLTDLRPGDERLKGWKAVDSDDLIGGLTMLIFGLGTMLVAGGGWRSLLLH